MPLFTTRVTESLPQTDHYVKLYLVFVGGIMFQIRPLSGADIRDMKDAEAAAKAAFLKKVGRYLNTQDTVPESRITAVQDYFSLRGIHLKPQTLAEVFGRHAKQRDARLALENLHENHEMIEFSNRFKHFVRQAKDKREKMGAKRVLPQSRIYFPLPGSKEPSFARQVVESYLQKQGYTVTDYSGGYATDAEGKQQYKIGKILAAKDPVLQDEFDHDRSRFLDNYAIVLTDDIEDIMKMTTARAWRSCMRIDGSQKKSPIDDAGMDTVVAYLIKRSDPDIRAPLARASLKTLVSPQWQNRAAVYTVDAFYGLSDPYFEAAVRTLSKDLTALYSGRPDPVGWFTRRRNLYYERGDDVWNLDGLSTEDTLRQMNVFFKKDENGFCVVDGSVNLLCKNLDRLPNLSRAIIKGNFTCAYNNLTTLEGAPHAVLGHFACNGNQITDLTGAPQTIKGDFNCSENRLINLKGAPQEGVRTFNASENKLTSLDGAPMYIDGLFECADNPDLPKIIRLPGLRPTRKYPALSGPK